MAPEIFSWVDMKLDPISLERCLRNIPGSTNIDPNKPYLPQLETRYQQQDSRFSPAYLAGSSWYVGPSLTDYLQQRPLHRGVFSLLCYLGNKI